MLWNTARKALPDLNEEQLEAVVSLAVDNCYASDAECQC